MCDKLVFDLAQEVEGSPNVFVRKDWINILDNQNQNYNNNQSIIDTSQLSNSNKYMSYREAYFSIPFVMSLATTSVVAVNATAQYFTPATETTSADMAMGLKNWFGQIIHSFTLDYNGTTIIQQTPYINMWNSFKLMTSLSLDDINTQGATIGFYPDDALSWQFVTAGSEPVVAANVTPQAQAPLSGIGVCNNTNQLRQGFVSGQYFGYASGMGNDGYFARQQFINFDVDGAVGSTAGPGIGRYSSLINAGGAAAARQSVQSLWKSLIYNKVNGAAAQAGILQTAVVATVYLKHIHSFFNMCPLLKGVFMKMTMNLNNTTTEFITQSSYPAGPNGEAEREFMTCSSVSSPLGGVNPLMIASGMRVGDTSVSNGGIFGTKGCGGMGLFAAGVNALGAVGTVTFTFRANLSVGSRCLDAQLSSLAGIQEAPLSKSVYLYIPAYTFNPVFEQAYLSSPVKQIKYTDVYQYQVLGVAAGQPFNNLLTNGIANVKSVLILPFYSTSTGIGAVATNGQAVSENTGFTRGLPVFQSPFDPAGTGPTSPLCWITNFNVQVSGQNAIYNLEKYNFEQFNNQLYGQNSVNGGLTDGLTSGLIDRQKFDMCYNYYYVNIERMLPVEMSVPKSIQVLGQTVSGKALDLYCFVEYGVDISIDCLTGARV